LEKIRLRSSRIGGRARGKSLGRDTTEGEKSTSRRGRGGRGLPSYMRRAEKVEGRGSTSKGETSRGEKAAGFKKKRI